MVLRQQTTSQRTFFQSSSLSRNLSNVNEPLYDNNGRAAYEKREKRRKIRALQDDIEKNNTDGVKELLLDNFDVDFQYRGQTALQLAVREGRYDICKLLLQKGADVNKCDAELNNLLNMACWRGYTDVAQLLINNNADLNARNDFGSTSLNTCVYKGYADICEKLLEANCDLDIPNSKGYSPLLTAVWANKGPIVDMLLAAGCDVNYLDEESNSPLILATQLGYTHLITALLRAGADVNIQNKFGRFALYEAASRGFLDIARQLITAETAQLNLRTGKGFTALLESIRQNYMDIAHLLLDSGCDPNISDRNKQAPIHAAVRQVSQYFGAGTSSVTALVKRLISAGAEIDVIDSQGWCPLYQSAFAGDVELTMLLVNHSAKLTALTINKESVLHGAVSANVPEIVDLLINTGCSVNTVNHCGEHPLYTAVKTRANIKIVDLLIRAGSDLDLCETKHMNGPIHEALVQHHTEAALMLLDAGCDVHTRNVNHQTPMYTACEKGNEKVLQWLLASPSIDLRAANSHPVALHAAVSGGQSRIVTILIEAGSNINQLNENCMTPIQTAAHDDNFPMARLLLKYGADLSAHRDIPHSLNCCLRFEDPHPHFELEPMFFAVKHRNIEMMKLFLTCYFHLPHHLVKVIGTIIQSTPELYSHYPIAMRKEILTMFANSLRFPRTLQELCRAMILQTLGACPHRKVPTLPLAAKVKDFLLQKDMFDPPTEEHADPGLFPEAR